VLVLTDLADWSLEPLASLAGAAPVKHRLASRDEAAVAFLRQVFPGRVPPAVLAGGASAAGRGWRALAVVDRADSSQYDQLTAAARQPAGVPAPVAAIALAGRGFHGNRGRPWSVERGNLHLSCVVPADLDAAASARVLPAVPALAVSDAIAACAPSLAPRLKWVNDVLLGDEKVAGALTASQSRGSRIVSLAFGVGINLAVAPAVAPTVFVPRVTCLHAHAAARSVGLGDLCLAVLDALERRLRELQRAGPASLVETYRERCGDIGREVLVWEEGLPDAGDVAALPPPIASGRVLALDDDLALRVEGASGPLSRGRLAYRPVGPVDPVSPDDREPAV